MHEGNRNDLYSAALVPATAPSFNRFYQLIGEGLYVVWGIAVAFVLFLLSIRRSIERVSRLVG